MTTAEIFPANRVGLFKQEISNHRDSILTIWCFPEISWKPTNGGSFCLSMLSHVGRPYNFPVSVAHLALSLCIQKRSGQ